ncbi:cell wall metabolism sensor histidine kinase WalK [uncultured Tessaracoccus sp.]|uniref:sensor histidine kinase n=1 Tax=uncultured Tessaracoccus sp. TaxID=905023 RepID=UPI0026035674|nr:HAMP domain-containing sensor histidine kinase [uncultured Tessaracoccus sp.]
MSARPATKGTLTRQVQTRVAVTVAIMAVLLSLLTLVVAQNVLMSQLDSQIEAIPQILGAGPDPRRPGIPSGTLIAGSTGGATFASVVAPGEVRNLDGGVASVLSLSPGIHTVNLPGLGSYRVHVSRGDSSQLVVGLPTAEVKETMLWLSLSALAITVVTVATTVLVTQRIIRDATRPLHALGETAAQVSAQRLDRGTVEVPRFSDASLAPEHEVARVGAAFNQMLDNVEGALVAREASEQKLRRFVADASHELRNPLASISGYSELVEQHADGLADDTAFALGRISAESQRMRKLVEDMMVLARLDARQQVEPQPVDAVEVALNAVSDARASSSRHRWTVSLPDEPVEVLAGADQLQQVMVNLLGNARTHTPEGTVVETAVSPDGVITVTDDGPGIPADVLPHVFERFTRADEARRHTAAQSTGLGLAIVKAQVESFGGQVRVESRPGRTQFAVRLPLAESGFDTPPPAATQLPDAGRPEPSPTVE